MNPERNVVGYTSISYERFLKAVAAGADEFGVLPDEIGQEHEDFARGVLEELHIQVEPKPVDPVEALLERLETYANNEDRWGHTLRAMEIRAVVAELREVLANDER